MTYIHLGQHDPARHAFDYFRCHAYNHFVQRGYPSLWVDCAISSALNNLSVFYAVAATGMAERALTQIAHTTLARPVRQEEGKLAVKLYSAAIAAMGGPMQSAITRSGPVRPIVLSCLVLMIFETTLGTHANALRHARLGYRILNACSIAKEEPVRMSSGISSDCSSGTGRQNSLPPRSPAQRTAISELAFRRPIGPSPMSSTLDDSRRSLECLIETAQDICAELRRKAQMSMPGSIQPDDMAGEFCLINTFSRIVEVGSALQEHMNRTLAGLIVWAGRLRQAASSTSPMSSEHLVMQIRHFQAFFTLTMSRGLNERLTDNFSDFIAHTLDTIERLLQPQSLMHRAAKAITLPIANDLLQRTMAIDMGTPAARNLTHIQGDISPSGPAIPTEQRENYAVGIFAAGILPALFTIAGKCRTSTYRRRAIRLLKEANRAEAINCSRTLAAYAEAVVNVEERFAAQTLDLNSDSFQLYADEVPDKARFLDVVVSEKAMAKPMLYCTRFGEKDGQFELLRYEYDVANKQYCVSQCRLVEWLSFRCPEPDLTSSPAPLG